jgi:hypothetical protein
VTDAEALQRFVRAAATLDPDLAGWTSAAVWRGLPPSRRRRIRDDLLREAARRLPPVSAWRKAHLLADLARAPASRPSVTTAAGLVALAVAVYRPDDRRDRDLSASQIFRVAFSRISPLEMEEAEAADSNPMLDIFLEEDKHNG